MRISLLIQREPFGSIFETTIAKFLELQTGVSTDVHWTNGHLNNQRVQRKGYQIWLCNIYLNTIFSNTARNYVFDPIRREFSRSTTWWRRPLQSLYVDTATHPFSRAYLAQHSVEIAPAVINAEHCLFIGGNYKIRFLDAANKISYGILKAGFPLDSIYREITTRQYVEKLGLPVPALTNVDTNKRWFCEEYISGTPLNRLIDLTKQKQIIDEVFRSLQLLYQTTKKNENTAEYINHLYTRIDKLVSSIALLDDEMRVNFRNLSERLFQFAEKLINQYPNIVTVLSHGDLQPANILVNENVGWLIDWEYSDRRFADYDQLVFGLQARSKMGLAQRLSCWVNSGTFDNIDLYVKRDYSEANRKLLANIFLLEELALQLSENDNSQFISLGHGLLKIKAEITIWIDMTERYSE